MAGAVSGGPGGGGKADLASALTAEAIAAPRPTHMLVQQFEPVPAASWQIGALRGAKVRPRKRPLRPLAPPREGEREVRTERETKRGERELYNKPSPLLHPIVGENPTTLASLGS